MDLLIFAHRGEAQTFIRKIGLQARFEILENYYSNDKIALYISAEGVENSMVKLSFLLGKLPHISKVINLGIAGALNDELELNRVYPIRCAYAYNDGPLFHSYSSECKKGIDCISHSKRVLTNDDRNKLICFADLVDRELWGLAKSCQYAKRPWEAYKLISDYAGDDAQCFDIKGKAEDYSNILFEYYRNNIQLDSEVHTEADIESVAFEELKTSFTQKKQIEKLISRLSVKENIAPHKLIAFYQKEIKEKKLSTKEVIYKLGLRLNPLRETILNKHQRYFKHLREIGAHIQHDPLSDQQSFRLQMQINSQANIDRLRRALDMTTYHDFENLMNGNLE